MAQSSDTLAMCSRSGMPLRSPGAATEGARHRASPPTELVTYSFEGIENRVT